MSTAKINVAVYTAGLFPEFSTIDGGLESLQAIVGGYIERLPMHEGLSLVCNEDGQMRGLPVSHVALMQWGVWQPIAGPFFVCRIAGADFASLKPDDPDRLLKYLRPV